LSWIAREDITDFKTVAPEALEQGRLFKGEAERKKREVESTPRWAWETGRGKWGGGRTKLNGGTSTKRRTCSLRSRSLAGKCHKLRGSGPEEGSEDAGASPMGGVHLQAICSKEKNIVLQEDIFL